MLCEEGSIGNFEFLNSVERVAVIAASWTNKRARTLLDRIIQGYGTLEVRSSAGKKILEP